MLAPRCEKLIEAGRVALNGETVKSPALNVDADALITVDGKPIPDVSPAKLWRYHKPPGLVTSHRDPEGRPTVFSQLPRHLPRVVSVGRLDINSEGLLLLTNDGETRPQARTAVAGLGPPLPGAGAWRGLPIQARPAEARRHDRGRALRPGDGGTRTHEGKHAWVMVSLNEGKNREVKKLMEHLGLKVARLIRVSFGPFHLGQLPEGDVDEIPAKVWREQLGMSKTKRG